jgi:N5-(cytidine 5'-diphosphoramidyl)-L-glutamine hydrolase
LIKKIGISLRVENIKKYEENRDSISHDWIELLTKLNFIPILIPNKLHNVEVFLKEMKLDGLILSGGDNIGDYPERDITEKKIIDFAILYKIPMLGVCRGMQVLNQFFEGTTILNENNNHVAQNHSIEIINSKFPHFQNFQKFEVNSFHNNLIKNEILGDKLIPFAISKIDKTIEGFYHENLPFVGVMWHPERDNSNFIQTELLKMIYCDEIWLN